MRRLAVLLAAAALVAPASASEIWLTMDHVHTFAFKTPVSQIIVGNPAIADVKVQDPSNVLLFGKAPGLTNIIALDKSGKEIDNLSVRVRSNNVSMLTVQKGAQRVSLSCTSNCEPAPAVGDAPSVFSETSGQVDQKAAEARTAASGSN